jgi:hypothetical protein
MLALIIGAIIAILASIGTAMFVEYMRRPRLSLSIEHPAWDMAYPPQHPVKVQASGAFGASGPSGASGGVSAARFLRVYLENKPLRWWAAWMVRSPALQCRATITFHHLNDGQNIFGRVMSGRWSGSPEPVPLRVVGPGGAQFQIIDFSRLTFESRIDVYPGEREVFDIAARFDNDDECYGWNNEAYFSQPIWRNPAWKLDKGRYLVQFEIRK